MYKPYIGLGMGLATQQATHLAGQFRVGVFRDIGSPVKEQLGWSAEYYLGVRDVRFDNGVRALLVSNAFGLGAGVDLSLRDGSTSLLVMVSSPVQRGGVFGRGGDLRFEWLPARRGAFNFAVTVPVAQPHRGKTRPLLDHVRLRDQRPRSLTFRAEDPTLLEVLERVRETAQWINRFTVPGLGGLAEHAERVAADAVAPLKLRLADHSVEDEIRAYHRELARAFSLAVLGAQGGVPAAGSTPIGDSVAVHAEAILLDRVLFPYNRLLGQWKDHDTTREFAGHARGVFARWLVTESGLSAERTEAALYVFQRLLDVVEEIRAANRQTWGDSRLVWLPLQLALEPEQYDEQEELDTLVSHAVGHAITHGNRLWYLQNDRFELELIKSIERAEDYHVLWIHDFRGLTEARRPDRLSLLVATHAYIAALRDRVRVYDSTGRLPVYMIFLDQHYFEMNGSRALLNLLQDPLGRRAPLPAVTDSLGRALTAAQEELRQAVAASRLLQTERAQYGDAWLNNRIKVHVSVTNPADPSFRSRQILPLIGMPDDVMRDHRKVVLFDVSEADPYRGMAMYAGMGVGEKYAGPAWEDRAVMLQGPAALALRDEARVLLEVQGIRGGDVPHVLRPRPKAPDYDRRVTAEIATMDSSGRVATRAIDLHNGIGFAPKEISVAEATVFNLMSPGGVVKVPDSVWMNELLASLLVGGSLRGVKVLVIAPSAAASPSENWATLALIHDLLTRLLAVRRTLGPELARAGGLLRVGLYDADVGVDDLLDRIRALRGRLADTPFLRQLYAFDPAVYQVLDSADAVLGPPPSPPHPPAASGGLASPVAADSVVRPKLHFKGFLYISREAWAGLMGGPPMAAGLREYLRQRVRQLREGGAVEESVMAEAMQAMGAATINPVLDTLRRQSGCTLLASQCARRWAFFLQVGSANQDYRTMAMDGEAALLVSKWTSLYALPDFVMLTGLTAWPEDQAALDRLLPPPSDQKLMFAWWLRMAL